MDHTIRWFASAREGSEGNPATKPIQRIQFMATQGGSGGESIKFEWCQGELRGHGLVAFEDGFLLRANGQETGSSDERKVIAWNGLRPSHGVYDPGDLIINISRDTSNRDYFYRPKIRFGYGPEWESNSHYRIGDTIIAGDITYVAIAFKYTGSNRYAYRSPISREYRIFLLSGVVTDLELAPGSVFIHDQASSPQNPQLFIKIRTFEGVDIEVREEDVLDRSVQIRKLEEFLIKSNLWRLSDSETIEPIPSGQESDTVLGFIRTITGSQLPKRDVAIATSGNMPFLPGAEFVEDGQIVWMRWGSAWREEAASELVETLGRRTRDKRFKIRALAAHSSKEFKFNLRSRPPEEIGDGITVSPLANPPMGLCWNAYISEDEEGETKVYFRVSNITPEPIMVEDELMWRFEHWRH